MREGDSVLEAGSYILWYHGNHICFFQFDFYSGSTCPESVYRALDSTC